MGAAWTDELVAEMKKLLEEGLSCSQVAARIGCSRNAVIGKVHRIEQATGETWVRARVATTGPRERALRAEPHKRPPRPAAPRLVSTSTPAPAPTPSRREQRQPPPRRAPPLPAAIALQGIKPAKVGTGCGILQTSGCRWAVGFDPKVIGRHIFCNAEVMEGQSYCDDHRRKNISAIVKVPVPAKLKAERRFA